MLIPLVLAMALAAAVSFVRDGLQRDAMTALDFLPDLTIQKMVGGRVDRVPVATAQRIQALPGISRILPRVWGYVPIKAGDQQAILTVMGMGPLGEFGVVQGRMPQAPGECVIGAGAAQALGLESDQSFTLRDFFGAEHTLQTVGILEAKARIYGADLLLTTPDTARGILGYRVDECSDICVYLDNGRGVDAAAAAINAEVPGMRILARDVLADITRQTYGGRAGLVQLLWLLLLLAVLLSAWAQGVALHTGLGREVGILRATGWSMMDVMEAKLLEAVALGILGTVSGIGLGLVYVLIGAPGIRNFFLGWSAIFPRFAIPLACEPESILVLVTLGLIPLLIVTLWSAWRLSIIDPDAALRG